FFPGPMAGYRPPGLRILDLVAALRAAGFLGHRSCTSAAPVLFSGPTAGAACPGSYPGSRRCSLHAGFFWPALL
ncbi:hypothetical protein N1I81_22485, partial [Bacillus sp. FSL M8-0052]|uniref:hypothetical protein n=1 Tax=Bacillus sp. FSL M8-0052 TaxID=2978203 RepID=UPI0030F84E2B